MRTDDLNFDLPAERIAQHPAEPRDTAKLMLIDRATRRVEHLRVRDLPNLGILGSSDLMVVNDTRVLPASFHGIRTDTGGALRGLFLEQTADGQWLLMLETRGHLKHDETITLHDTHGQPALTLRLTQHLDAGNWLARPETHADPIDTLERIGTMPLPPYIRKARKQAGLPEVESEDAQRYNTVFAEQAGSAAAPTAGLHLTPQLLEQLCIAGLSLATVTLHVGLGTFAPVRTELLEQHALHSERIVVPPETIAALQRTRESSGRILAVGTTSVRTLESLPDPLPADGYTGSTDLYVHPGLDFNFRFTDRLLTNFHLPGSTLLALVASLPGVGIEQLLDWYRTAIDHDYRFYSYGDAMLLL
ncbi:tRNA preQ1(34) S-adenosylmethionine ribosyltransferase-isomerase QueA [Mucisphaera calidilacus]|uniref:S-adenosylmethionine:tRNA ribosyltransferase-isomerase n=1 Tax=Mucisphaera calidilacus TaxID=2527982 RepID=A0A518BUX3_9BACT|nr:tRNA preQ1(34) S-adenosylmethionine ribosyltransferase-isomerase QueA [Mucisphaera calidilacus]QDU70761.1 S-adenosylmethionine:tRNA ribosyltransferase-isomerase [Mucisphaera calidilacus]